MTKLDSRNQAVSQVAGEYPRQVHLSEYIQILRRRKWLLLIFFATVVTIVTFFSIRMTPTYRSTIQLIIELPVNMIPVGEMTQGSSGRNEDYLMTQYNLLRSRSLAYKVIEELELWKLFELSREDNNDELWISPMMVNWYMSNLEIAPVRGGRLVNVSFTGPDREILPKIVTAHTRAFIETNSLARKSSAENAFDWIKTQLQAQKIKVEESRSALNNYTKESNLVSFEGRDNIVSQKLFELNSALTSARSERMAKLAVYEQLQEFSINKEDLISLPEIKRDPVIQSLRTQHAGLKAQKLEMATRFGPKHPRMIEFSSGIEQLERDITAEVFRLRTAIKAELDRALALEKSLGLSLEEQKQAAMAFNEKAVEYDVLKRQAESDQRLYDMLLQQAKEVSLVSLMDNSNARIVDPAETPIFPIRPRIFLNIMIAVFLGLFFGTVLAFFMEYMDNTVKVPDDVYRHLGLPVIGMLPYTSAQKKKNSPLLLSLNEECTENSNGTGAEKASDYACRLPSTMQLMVQGLTGRVIVIESAAMGEGKTTVLANLAVNLAREGLRVLMVDCDMQRPRLHSLFGIQGNGGGLSQLMAQVLDHNPEHGSLKDYTIDDLFFLISIRKRHCRLTIKNNDGQTMTAQFQNGNMVHISSKNNPPNNLLGSMLLKGGHITEAQLKDALERHDRTGQPLGYILLNLGYITREKLQGPLRLQTEEHLQKLFTWRHGEFHVEESFIEKGDSEKIFFNEDFSSTISRLGNLNGNRFLELEILLQIKSIPGESIHILPAGRPSRAFRSTLNIVLLRKFLDLLKKRFDVVLMDTPPVLDAGPSVPLGGSAVPIGTLADGVVMVIKAGHLSFKILNEAKNAMADLKIIGAVINQNRIAPSYYYHR
jgi:polysaccharide biosynthesis transport protein